MVRKCLTAAAMVTEILLLSPFPGKMHLNQLHTRVWYSCQLKKKTRFHVGSAMYRNLLHPQTKQS